MPHIPYPEIRIPINLSARLYLVNLGVLVWHFWWGVVMFGMIQYGIRLLYKSIIANDQFTTAQLYKSDQIDLFRYGTIAMF